MFAVLNGVVLRPLPYPRAERLLRVWSANPARDLPFFSVSARRARLALAAAVGCIALAAALASWAPARRAMRLDPVRVLREG